MQNSECVWTIALTSLARAEDVAMEAPLRRRRALAGARRAVGGRSATTSSGDSSSYGMPDRRDIEPAPLRTLTLPDIPGVRPSALIRFAVGDELVAQRTSVTSRVRRTPRSVMSPVTRRAGVTSNAGFAARAPSA